MVDGLQRISTILEFMGRLRKADGSIAPPSVLEATKYLPSLHNAVWENSDTIVDIPTSDQFGLDKSLQLAIRRARIGVEILKRPSDDRTKFDLFQRLNAGGSQANRQELRNCIMLMVNPTYFRAVRTAADRSSFRQVMAITEDQAEQQRHMEVAVRFLVHIYIPYDGKLDIEDYIDNGIIQLSTEGDALRAEEIMQKTFDLLCKIAGADALRRFNAGRFSGKVGLVALEGVAVGLAKNLEAIDTLTDPVNFVRQRVEAFWTQADVAVLTQPGMRGTTRIQRTVPFGEAWFRP